jgi:DMSO/TMAO reductase YedYZ molybdopterin-dependent catalytic subunit
MPLINRGFRRRRPLDPALAERLPPGQHLVKGFPVLTVGPTPRPRLEDWTLRIDGAIDMPRAWTWDEFWETHGYHHRGDPWREERYCDD